MDVREVAVGPDGTSFRCVRAGDTGPVELRTPLVGYHQAANAATALAMLDAAGAGYRLATRDVAEALARVHLPGRFHRYGSFIFDVAHNPAGATVLAETLRAVTPPRPVAALVTVLRDKDWRGMLAALAPVIDHFVLSVAPTAPASRLWDPAEALAFAQARGWSAELVPAFDEALERAAARGATVVVTGSFHTAGDAMERLQVSPHAG
jgi:dihydrofolate synthase/folylpolyglutamate synthase